MFTGLVEEIGKIRTVRPRGDGLTLTIAAKKVLEGVKLGDSIAISGVCQTVIDFSSDSFTVEAIRETMKRTKFGSYKSGDDVNLERALKATDRLGGHIVQGHVDGLVEILSIKELSGSKRVRMNFDKKDKGLVVEKGSVTIDGISLTIAAVGTDWFEVEIIPHTWEQTILKNFRRGTKINVEWDVLAKYLRSMLSAYKDSAGISMEDIYKAGF